MWDLFLFTSMRKHFKYWTVLVTIRGVKALLYHQHQASTPLVFNILNTHTADSATIQHLWHQPILYLCLSLWLFPWYYVWMQIPPLLCALSPPVSTRTTSVILNGIFLSLEKGGPQSTRAPSKVPLRFQLRALRLAFTAKKARWWVCHCCISFLDAVKESFRICFVSGIMCENASNGNTKRWTNVINLFAQKTTTEPESLMDKTRM